MENLPQQEKERPEDAASGRDNSTNDEFMNVANPMAPGSESTSDDPGQDGRNIRPLGGMDQDSENGVLRMNDMDNSTMEVTPEAIENAPEDKTLTQTSTVSVTTAGPDDDASADETPVPTAELAAKEAADGPERANLTDGDETDANDSATNSTDSQEKQDHDIGETGTSLSNQPAY